MDLKYNIIYIMYENPQWTIKISNANWGKMCINK